MTTNEKLMMRAKKQGFTTVEEYQTYLKEKQDKKNKEDTIKLYKKMIEDELHGIEILKQKIKALEEN